MPMTPRFRFVLLVPAVTLAAGGCFATRGDVRILQDDLQKFRAEMARSDSLRAAEAAARTEAQSVSLNATLEKIAATIRSISDSLRKTSELLVRYHGDSRTELRQLAEQMINLQERLGASAATLQSLRAELEARERQ